MKSIFSNDPPKCGYPTQANDPILSARRRADMHLLWDLNRARLAGFQ